MRAMGFGDNIIDRFTDRKVVYPGGNCVNFAVFARQLGAESAYLGVFGTDAYAGAMRGALTSLGVDISECVTVEGESGLTDIYVSEGERVFGEWNGGGVTVAHPIVLTDRFIDYLSGFDIVHSSAYSSLESQLPRLREIDCPVSFDFSDEPVNRSPEYLDRVAPYVDLALFSCSAQSADETRTLLADAVRRGAQASLGTRGTGGAIFFDGTDFHEGDAVVVNDPIGFVDTMGCGDAFLTAFALDLLQSGWSRDTVPGASACARALRVGAENAARQCLVEGAFGHGRRYGSTPSGSLWVEDLTDQTR
ncbi:MAG: PfkB family carbohydrate kinase [Homoserinimonas sp.]